MVTCYAASAGAGNCGFRRCCRPGISAWQTLRVPIPTSTARQASSSIDLCRRRARAGRLWNRDVDAAFDALTSLYLVQDALASTNEPLDKPLQRLRDLLEGHMTPEGVFFDFSARGSSLPAGQAEEADYAAKVADQHCGRQVWVNRAGVYGAGMTQRSR